MALLIRRGSRPLDLARWVVAIGCAMGLRPLEGRAQEPPGRLEQQVKAAYLLNFTRYVDWPAGTFPDAESPVNLCVLGESEFADVVARTVEGRRSRGRPVRLLRPDIPSQAGECHVAFVDEGWSGAREWLSELRRFPALIVGDGTRFLRRGGMVAFVIVDETVRFAIDEGAARRAGLRISSRVLALATRVSGPSQEAR